MFERIVFHETRRGLPGSAFEVGFLAETMLFYGHTHVVVSRGSLSELLDAFGPETLIAYLRDGHMTMTYTPNLLGVLTHGERYDLGLAMVERSSLQDFAQKLLTDKTGKSGRGRRLALQLRDLVKEDPLADGLPAQARQEWGDAEYVARTAAHVLKACAHAYELPQPLVFKLNKEHDGTFVVDTNINFDAANIVYHVLVPPEHSTLSPAYLLSHIANARMEVELAARFNADLATNAVSSAIISDRIACAMHRSAEASEKGIAYFQDVALGDVPSLREVMTSRQRSFEELRPLLERAKHFRQWISGKSPNGDLVRAYHKEVTKESWVDKLPARPVRFVLFTAAGLVIDAAGLGGVGTIAGIALNAADTFVLEKLARGWRPNQFVDGPLKEFLRGRK